MLRQMPLQKLASIEPFLANLTRERLLPRMAPHMPGKMTPERLTANLAAVRL